MQKECINCDLNQVKKICKILNYNFDQEKQLTDLVKQELEDCTKKLQELQVILDASNSARVEVNDRVYSGTRICIADVSMGVKDTVHYCKFVKSQGDVKMVGL